MKSFKQFLNESKVAHLAHVEDGILLDGPMGVTIIVNFLSSLIDMLSGVKNEDNEIILKHFALDFHYELLDEAIQVGLKWDGAPGLTAGIDPVTKKFFVGTKSVFAKKNPKINFTNRDIMKNHSGQGALPDKLKLALKLFPKIWKKGVFKGDLMFIKDMVEKETIDGESFITFRPNNITYAVQADSDIGKQIAGAKIGIAFHTKFSGKTIADMKPSFNVSKKDFNKSKDVWFDDSNLPDVSSALFKSGDASKAKKMLSQLKKMSKVTNTALKKVHAQEKNIIKELIRFNNANVKTGTKISDEKKYWDSYVDWLVGEKKSKLKTFNDDKEKDLRDKLARDSKEWNQILKFYSLTIEIKELIIRQLNKVKQVKTFVKTADGFKVVGQEGFVGISPDGKIIKLVDRMEFTKNLFTTGKDWDKGEKPKV